MTTFTTTQTRTPTTMSATTIMIARPLVVRYHDVDFDLLTSFEWPLAVGCGGTAGFSRGALTLPEARGTRGKGNGGVGR